MDTRPAPAGGAEGARRSWLQIPLELALVGSASLVYFAVRATTGDDASRASTNADLIVRLERALGIFWEATLQDVFLRNDQIATVASWIYIWGFWPVIGPIALWLYFRRPAAYTLFRNTFLLSGAVGLIFFLAFPVAPPRLMPLDIADTVLIHTEAYRVLQPPALTNQYAAMPSFHFGWLVLMGVALHRESRSLAVRIFGWAIPALMGWTIVVTGNHYIVDGVVGAIISLAALALLERRIARRGQPRHGRGRPAPSPLPPPVTR
jgi:membrane-associated phospholipid phosphatase